MIRIGIIGLDSSHAIEFTRAFNAGIPGARAPLRVVAACSGGATDFPLSVTRRDKITRELADGLRIPILGSTVQLAAVADVFMILSCDGRCHRHEVLEVVAAGKPIFIDKPLSADWRDAGGMLRTARFADTPCFSASALRYRAGPGHPEIPAPERPAHLEITVPRREEPGHPDLSWHGTHGIEAAFALLGPGCQSVQRSVSLDADTTTGTWADGSTGRIRRSAEETARNFPGRVQTTTAEHRLDGYAYTGLLGVMAEFFRTGIPPLSDRELIEPLAFAAAADASRDAHGAAVNLPDFLAAGAFDCELSSRSR